MRWRERGRGGGRFTFKRIKNEGKKKDFLSKEKKKRRKIFIDTFHDFLMDHIYLTSLSQ